MRCECNFSCVGYPALWGLVALRAKIWCIVMHKITLISQRLFVFTHRHVELSALYVCRHFSPPGAGTSARHHWLWLFHWSVMLSSGSFSLTVKLSQCWNSLLAMIRVAHFVAPTRITSITFTQSNKSQPEFWLSEGIFTWFKGTVARQLKFSFKDTCSKVSLDQTQQEHLHYYCATRPGPNIFITPRIGSEKGLKIW